MCVMIGYKITHDEKLYSNLMIFLLSVEFSALTASKVKKVTKPITKQTP